MEGFRVDKEHMSECLEYSVKIHNIILQRNHRHYNFLERM